MWTGSWNDFSIVTSCVYFAVLLYAVGWSVLFYFLTQDTKDTGVIGKGANYSDECGENNDCMTLLSLQVAMLMIMKPLPKLFSDVIKP